MTSVVIGLFGAIFAFAAIAGLVDSWPVAVVGGCVVGALVAWAMWRWPIVDVDDAACSRAWKLVALAATIVAIVQVGRLTVFMIDSSRPSYSVVPSSKWEIQHSCLSAYYVAAREVDRGNVYDDTLYSLPGNATAPRTPRLLGPFKIDVYEYPPPFLLLPRVLVGVTADFDHLRMLWFGLSGGIVLAAMLLVAGALGRTTGTRALLLLPLVWAAFPTLSAFQKGNVQLVVIAMSMLAMVQFERRRPAVGGALLAFATASKLYPGMLLVYLLVRRDWRAFGWTMAMSGVLVVLSLLDTGWAPYASFLDHLPGLVGGEAFPAFRNPAAMAINYSVPGVVFKLQLFGVPGMTFPAAKIVGWLYTGVMLWATVAVARRVLRDDDKPLVWLAILVLATLRSPFLPQAYAGFPPLWLMTLVAAVAYPTSRTLALTLGGWIVLNLIVPLDWGLSPIKLAIVSTLPQTLTIVLAALALRRAASPNVVSDGGPRRV